MNVDLTVNGKDITADVEDRMLLVHFLRDVADLTATNVGCDTTSCGACTVLLDGESVKSCTVLAAQASGHEVTTVEGLAANGEMHPVQRAFHARARAAVRVLHARHGDGHRVTAEGEPAPDRGRGSVGPGRQPVPLHRLPQHRQGARCGRGPGKVSA